MQFCKQLSSTFRIEMVLFCCVRIKPVPSWTCLKAVIKLAWHIPVPNVQWRTPDDGQRNCPKHVEFLDENKFGKISASVGFIKKKKVKNENIFFFYICEFSQPFTRLEYEARYFPKFWKEISYLSLTFQGQSILSFWSHRKVTNNPPRNSAPAATQKKGVLKFYFFSNMM